MKLFSFLKKREKKLDPVITIQDAFLSNYKKLLDELANDNIGWKKPFGVKKFESFILAKFITDYSFNTLYVEDLDKDQIDGYQRLCDSTFIIQHDILFNGILKYIDMESIINEKIENYKNLRKENRPPECWHIIFSLITNNPSYEKAQKEVENNKSTLELVKSNKKFKNLIKKSEQKLLFSENLLQSYVSIEVTFPRIIRQSKAIFKKINTKKIKAAVKKLEKAEKKKDKKK
jgi:hypothetical protein